MLESLIKLGGPKYTVHIVASFLIDRDCANETTCGVPQRSVLGPFL